MKTKTVVKKIPNIISPAVKILESNDTSTVFRAVGIPYGGPDFLEGKDLHGQFFDKNTDLGVLDKGEIRVPVLYAFYDHALNENVGRQKIGYAKFYAETDEGMVFDIEVERAFRYHDMLLTLAQKGLLGASSQPVQTSVDIDWETGHIKQWHAAEISLTPMPANPLAVVNVMKSFGIDAEVETDQTSDENLDEEIAALFTDESDNQTPETTIVDLTPVLDMIKAIQEKLVELDAHVVEIKSSQTETSAAVVAEILKNRSGIKTFAEQVATRLKTTTMNLVDELSGSVGQDANSDEQTGNSGGSTSNRKKSVIPANAPGLK